MSSQNDISLKLKLTAEGIKEAAADSEKLNQSLEKGQAIANRPKSVSAAYKAAQTSSENVEAARAVAGTGGSGGARDFARESQGLGGLVRLYAVLAANIYAADTAAKALSNAMNTTNMVAGLNQLGAASGVALGSLSKQLITATDGAISLKEAMAATAKATVAGVSGKELQELTKIAVNTSRVLGIDTGDALNRLVSGIEKQRPVLFETLGIYAKIVPAEEAYAKSLNKSVSSLTQAEKSQALLNAVLAEGTRKYGDIDIDVNPYQKLQATLTNLTQSGLEFVNKFLGPLATVLADNTGLLTTIIGALATKLVGSAIPALTSWRSELAKSAQVAKDKAVEINQSFGEKFVERMNAKLKIPELESNLREAEQKYAASRVRFLEIDNNYKRKSQSILYKDISTGNVTDETLTRAQKEINAKSNEGTEESLRHAKSLNELKNYYTNMENIRKQATAAQDILEGQSQKVSPEDWARAKISQRAGSRADSLAIRSAVAGNVEGGGFGYALDEMNKQIAKSTDMSPWTKWSTSVRGTLGAVATQVGIFGSALQGALGWIGLITTAANLLVNAFAKAGDETKKFSDDISYLQESTKNAELVYKKYKDTISTESLTAKSNVAKTFGDQIDQTIQDLSRLEEKAGWADRLKDTISTAFGGGIRKDFGENIGRAVEDQLKLIPTGPIKDEAEKQIRSILDINGEINKDSISNKFYWMDNADQITSIANKLSSALKPAQSEAKNLGATAKDLNAALSNSADASQKLLLTLQNKDPLVSWGESLVKVGSALQASTDNTQTLVAALSDLKSKSEGIQLMSPEEYSKVIQFSESLPDIVKNIDQYSTKLKQLETTKLGLDKAISAPGIDRTIADSLKQQRDKVTQEINSTKLVITLNEGALTEIKDKITELSQRAIKEGYGLINTQLTYALQQAAISFSKSILSGVSGVGVAQASATLDIRALGVQKQQITVTEKLSEIMLQSNLIQSQRVAQESSAKILRDARDTGKPLAEEDVNILRNNNRIINNSNLILEAIGSGKALTGEQKGGLDASTQASNLQLESIRSGKSAQLAGLTGKQSEIAAQGRIGTIKELNDAQQKGLEIQSKSAQLEESKYKLLTQTLPFLSQSQLVQEKSLQDSLRDTQNTIEKAKIQGDITVNEQRIAEFTKNKDTASATAVTKINTELKSQLETSKQRQSVEQEIANIQFEQLKIADQYKAAAFSINMQRRVQEQILATDEAEVQHRSELLAIENQLGKYTAQQFADKEKALKLDQVAVEERKLLAAEERRYQDERMSLNEKVDQAVAAGATLKDIAPFVEAGNAADTYYNNQLALIHKTMEAKKADIDLTYSMSVRMKGMSDIVAGAFQNMADALQQFTHTGKLDFQGLINSMIDDLVRFELRAQMSKLYNSVGGLSGFMSGLLGTSQSTNSSQVGGVDYFLGNPNAKAKGAAYDYGVQAFAKGGTFSNSIVDSPTLFKFASGTGLMGEAGPEAIMPLKRDSNGTLGVQNHQGGGGGNVDVTVHNYGSEKAKTVESTDARGNRKIEIVIGEAAATDLTTNGSASQKAMGGTYGMRPQLIRR